MPVHEIANGGAQVLADLELASVELDADHHAIRIEGIGLQRDRKRRRMFGAVGGARSSVTTGGRFEIVTDVVAGAEVSCAVAHDQRHREGAEARVRVGRRDAGAGGAITEAPLIGQRVTVGIGRAGAVEDDRLSAHAAYGPPA